MSSQDVVREKMFIIRKAWVEKLPQKTKEIEQLWGQLLDAPWDKNTAHDLHQLLHNVAGASGTFGFPELGFVAREGEILVRKLSKQVHQGCSKHYSSISKLINRLVEMSDEALISGASPPPADYLSQIKRIREENVRGHLIYLVEDDPELAEEITRQLKEHQYDIETFSTLDAFNTALAEKEPDFVIMDIELPDGKSTDLLKSIYSDRPEALNSIFVSVHEDIKSRLDAIRAGGLQFIPKPIDISLLMKKLGEHLRSEWSIPLRVMIVDDSVSMSNYYSTLLKEAGIETTIVNEPLKTFNGLADFLPDIVLMDLHMPECSGEELAQLIRQHETFFSIPILFLSGEEGLENQLHALNQGGDDFIKKSTSPQHLIETVKHRAKRYRQIRSQLTRDELTGLPNRNALKDRLREAIRQSHRGKSKMVFAAINLDLFKKVNDGLGYLSGDQVLKEISIRIADSLRPGDSACRIGGDEFGLILLGADKSDSEHIADRIRNIIAKPIEIGSHQVHLNSSMGLTIFPEDGGDVDSLVNNADLALHAVKESGRDGVRFFQPSMGTHATRRLSLESEMRRAIKNEEFTLHYQPKIELPRKKIVGMEALVRWADPERGMVSPGEFIPLAEETGLIIPLGDWILTRACEDTKRWLTAGHDLRVAVNLSSRQFNQPDLVQQVKLALVNSGLPASNLELEITESMVMGDTERVILLLGELQQHGIHISVDDFGTGYSSLSYLKQFPINALKIDQSFIRDMHSDDDDYSIVRAIVSMGHSLRLDIVAEGVELTEQMDLLNKLECEFLQGFYFSKPLAAAEFETLIQSPDSLS